MTKTEATQLYIKGESFKLEKDKSYTLEEIITLSTHKWRDFFEAKGYLSAIKKGEDLVEVIREEHNPYMSDRIHDVSHCKTCRALTKWEDTK